MLFFMHIELAKAIYQEIFAGYDTGIEEQLFIYGNIKPDLMFVGEKSPHTSTCTLDKVKAKSLLIMSDEITDEARSVLYGEICHLICDYFCLYHADEAKYTKHLKHFFYEVAQYLKFSYKKLSGQNILRDLFDQTDEIFANKYFSNKTAKHCSSIFCHDKMKEFILENQQTYLNCSGDDLEMAFLNACSVCSYILAETQVDQITDIETIPAFYSSAV